MNEKKLSNPEKVLLEVYRTVYSKLNVDIDELIENGTTKKEEWYMEYEMIDEEQNLILEEILKKSNLSKYDKENVRFSYHLGCSPKSI